MKLKLSEYITLSSITIIILGIIKQIIYYNAFNIPILFFVGLSELGLFVSQDLIYTIPVIILVYLLLYSYASYKIESDNRNFAQKLEDYRHSKIIDTLIDVALSTILIICLLILLFYNIYYIKVMFAGIGIVAIIIAIITFSDKKEYLDLKKEVQLLSLGLGILFGAILVITSFQIRNVTAREYKKTIIRTASKEYISNDSIYFVGKTENYVFIYNSKEQSTEAIPNETITYIKIKSK